MFSALKKLTKSNDEKCSAPVPMSSSLQKKFSRGVHFNMKILIKGDRNVGKSCLLQRLQGGSFIEEYVSTEQIQVAPIHWTYKNTDHIVKVEVWEVVDKGKAKKKAPLGLKLENQNAPTMAEDSSEVPVLDATFLDVYKNANGVILMLDITKPWTFDYVVKELTVVPPDLPVVILGNHCDMQHHRQVHLHHIDQALHDARLNRTAPTRYAESSMRNGFGLRLLHKFFNVPFLRLQRTSLLEQLQRNQKDIEEVESELNEFQNSEESQYDVFVDRLTNKRRAGATATEARPTERSPSIVLGAGKPIVPPSVNPLMAHSLNPMGIKAMNSKPDNYLSPDFTRPVASSEINPQRSAQQDSAFTTPPAPFSKQQASSSGRLEEFYAGTLDSSFLEETVPVTVVGGAGDGVHYDSDSDENTINPMVNVDQDDLDIESTPTLQPPDPRRPDALDAMFVRNVRVNEDSGYGTGRLSPDCNSGDELDFPLWAGDSSARRSPEGGEDPDVAKDKDGDGKTKKKHKKKKSKDKDKDEYGERSEKKKHKSKKTKDEPSPQSGLLLPTTDISQGDTTYDDFYDSI